MYMCCAFWVLRYTRRLTFINNVAGYNAAGALQHYNPTMLCALHTIPSYIRVTRASDLKPAHQIADDVILFKNPLPSNLNAKLLVVVDSISLNTCATASVNENSWAHISTNTIVLHGYAGRFGNVDATPLVAMDTVDTDK